MESQNPRVAVFKHIDTMLKPEETLLDSDLNRIIEAIDDLLFREKEDTNTNSKKRKLNCEEEKMDLKLLEKWGNTIESVGEKISVFCENNIDIAVDVLEIIAKCHWAAAGFILVASVLEKWDTVKCNKKKCLRLLKSMNDLAKVVLELRPFRHKTANTQAKIKESIHTILKGAMSCSKMMDRGIVNGLVKSKKDKKELLEVRQEIEELRSILHVHISVCIFKRLFEGTKHYETNARNEVVDEESPTNDKSTVAIQTPSITHDTQKNSNGKRPREDGTSDSSNQPPTPSKQEGDTNKKSKAEGDTT